MKYRVIIHMTNVNKDFAQLNSAKEYAKGLSPKFFATKVWIYKVEPCKDEMECEKWISNNKLSPVGYFYNGTYKKV